jgi:hypothetical protein
VIAEFQEANEGKGPDEIIWPFSFCSTFMAQSLQRSVWHLPSILGRGRREASPGRGIRLIFGNETIELLLGSILAPASGRKSGRHPQLGEDASHEHQPGCQEEEENHGGEEGMGGMVYQLFLNSLSFILGI